MNRLELLVTDPAVRKVTPFCKGLGNVDIRAFSFLERAKKVRTTKGKKVYVSGPIILGKLFPSAAICFISWKSLFSGHQMVCRSRQGLVFICDPGIQKSVPWNLAAYGLVSST